MSSSPPPPFAAGEPLRRDSVALVARRPTTVPVSRVMQTSSPLAVEPGSYRDRNGRVYYTSDAVYRGLSARALADWDLLSTRRFFRRMMDAGKLVATERLDPEDHGELDLPAGWAGFLRHQRIPFVSYPYEWSFGMLKDAALLQLELLNAAIDEDMILKDGSAFNVQ